MTDLASIFQMALTPFVFQSRTEQNNYLSLHERANKTNRTQELVRTTVRMPGIDTEIQLNNISNISNITRCLTTDDETLRSGASI